MEMTPAEVEKAEPLRRLVEYRQARGLSVKQAAKRLGLRPSSVRTYESRVERITAELQRRFCLVYGVPPEFFLCLGSEQGYTKLAQGKKG